MPSKKSARKQRENKNDEVDWHEFAAALTHFKRDGTGSHIEDQLLKEFPLFRGKAPAGHPYPQAFTEGATDEHYCYVERVDDLVLLRRKLPGGRVISIDTCEFAMLNGGAGIVHLNMNNVDNRVENLKWVMEAEARKLLMEFEDDEDKRYQIISVFPDGFERRDDGPQLYGWEGDSVDLDTGPWLPTSWIQSWHRFIALHFPFASQRVLKTRIHASEPAPSARMPSW